MKNKILNKNQLIKIAILLFIVIISISTAKDGGDFDVYLEASRKLYNGENIYAPPFIHGLQYYYSVFFALILIPFSSIVFLTEVFWSVLSLLLLYRTLSIVKSYFDFSILTNRQQHIWIILTILLSLQFILYNISMIQITMFLLWGIFESINFINKKKNILAGTLLGVIINIKIMPILILPYLFYRGYFKAFISAVFTFILLLFLPALFIGQDYNQFLLREWWTIINPSNKEHLFETGIGTHSLVALIPVYLTETVGEMDFKRNIFNISHQNVEYVINISRLLILALSLFFFKSMPFKKEANKLKSFWEISFFVLIIPLLLPHQQKYAFLLAIPIVCYLLNFFIYTYGKIKTKGYYFTLSVFICCMLFFSPLYGSDIIGRFLFDYTQHYRFLTFATLFLIPISLYCNPSRLKSIENKNNCA